MSDQEDKARKILAKPSGGLSGKPGIWLKQPENSEARVLFEQWLDMAIAGETDWSASRLHQFLIEEYGFPRTNCSNFRAWCRQNFGEQYRKAIENRSR